MSIIVDRRLFLTADKSELVDEDDPRAAFLWAGEGSEVSEEEAKRVGYKGGTKKADDEPSGSGLTVSKEADQPANKAVEAPEADKAEPVKKAAKRTRKATKKAT